MSSSKTYYIQQQPQFASYNYCVVVGGGHTVYHCQTVEEAEAYVSSLERIGYSRIPAPR